MSRARAVTVFAAAAACGGAIGWLWARAHDRSHRNDLYATEAWQRFAALGWIASEGDADQLPVLQDYLTWERVPTLRQRALRIVALLESAA